jgi:cell shape-determining protein MreD
VIIVWALLGIGLALAGELALGSVAPVATRYVDLMMLPLATYALRRSQRSSMTVGCVSGLLQDYWIEPRLFDEGLQAGVRRLFGEALAPVHPLTLVIRALAGGLLTAGVLAIVGKIGRARSAARPARRKA